MPKQISSNKILLALFLCLLLFLQSCTYRIAQEEEHSFLAARKKEPVSRLVIIDPGHGGKDDGCKGVASSCLEKDLTLKTAKLTAQHLKKRGIRAVLTRNGDEFIPLDDRACFANERNAVLFVSIHFNSAPNSQAKGIEVYYFDEKTKRAEKSKQFAESALSKIVAFTCTSSRGVKSDDLRVIRKTKMPAILVEGGFLSNVDEERRCKDPVYQDALARAIADTIEEYLRNIVVPGAN